MKKKKISIVIPCHNEEKNIPLLIPEIIKNIPKKYLYEIICVDDGSSDNTKEIIFILGQKNNHIKGIFFHRNFGHQMALLAGIKHALGDAIVMMDADFQHPPKLIPKMLNEWENNHDLIRLIKNKKKQTGIKEQIRKLGYKIWSLTSEGTIIPGGSDFRLVDRQVANYLIKSNEREIFLRGMVSLISKNPLNMKYSVEKRKYGKSSYNFKRFLNMFINGFISFSTLPLRIGALIGLAVTTISTIILGSDILLSLITKKRIIQGYVTVVFLMLILNGFILFYLGIIGEYIGVVFREVKKRPKYIIDEKINLK